MGMVCTYAARRSLMRKLDADLLDELSNDVATISI